MEIIIFVTSRPIQLTVEHTESETMYQTVMSTEVKSSIIYRTIL